MQEYFIPTPGWKTSIPIIANKLLWQLVQNDNFPNISLFFFAKTWLFLLKQSPFL